MASSLERIIRIKELSSLSTVWFDQLLSQLPENFLSLRIEIGFQESLGQEPRGYFRRWSNPEPITTMGELCTNVQRARAFHPVQLDSEWASSSDGKIRRVIYCC